MLRVRFFQTPNDEDRSTVCIAGFCCWLSSQLYEQYTRSSGSARLKQHRRRLHEPCSLFEKGLKAYSK